MLTPAEISLMLAILERYEQDCSDNVLANIIEEMKRKLVTMQQFACEG